MKVKEIIEFLKEQDPDGEVVLCKAEKIGGEFCIFKADIEQIRVGIPKYKDIHCGYDKHILCITDAIKFYNPCKEPEDD